METFDVIVVGGGICGASIGWELAVDRRVCVLEQESQLAKHATGRSAATFVESYGGPIVSMLTSAGRTFLEQPPAGFGDPPVSPKPLVYFSSTGDVDRLRTFHESISPQLPSLLFLDGPQLQELCPLLRPQYATAGVFEPGALAIDVDSLHQGFVRGLRARGGAVRTSSRLASATRARGGWTVTDQDGNRIGAEVLVNAAGAWSDQVAIACGAQPVGITAYRRSAFVVAAPETTRSAGVGFVIDYDNAFYVKPDAGQLLCSPVDETPQPPADARPDEVEIARALDAINLMTTISTRHVRTSWGGLRSFAPDRLPVVGFDPEVEGLFWYAGQGGFGVQTSPALARTGAALLRGEQLPADVRERGVRAAQLAPDRPELLRRR